MKRWMFVLLAAFAVPASAQNYPNKPVQVVLAFTPGSAVDIVGRIVTAKLSEMWGQPVVNDNKSGAGGSIGAAGIKVTEVPFKGTPEVVAAILSQNVDGYWCPISACLSQTKGGKLRPLAVTTAKRNPTLPDVPTMAEAGVKNGESALWVAI